MSLHYILDAYNITHQMPKAEMSDAEGHRWALIHFVENRRPQGSSRNKVTIVFDGHKGLYDQISSNCAQILFSYDISADDLIKRIVSESDNRKQIIVVSNDRSVQYAVRALGAKVMKVEEFLVRPSATQSSKKKKMNEQPVKKFISQTTQSKINEELGAVWLKNDEYNNK